MAAPPRCAWLHPPGITALRLQKGADVVRTHDVRETADVIRMAARMVVRA